MMNAKVTKWLYRWLFLQQSLSWSEADNTKEASTEQALCFLFFFFFFILSELSLSQSWLCQKHPVKQLLAMVSGVCLWLISTCHQAAGRSGSEREREFSGNKGRLVWGHKTVPCGCQENKVRVKPIRNGSFRSWYWQLSPGMVDTWTPLWGSCWSEGGERRMVQMHSEDILTLWKSQMIGNYLVVFIQI